MRKRPEEARRYGELKETPAGRFPEDIDGYMEGKTEILLEFLAAASIEPADLETIREQNAGAPAPPRPGTNRPLR